MSSYERTLGQTLLADELACLSYWMIEDQSKKGYFLLHEAKPLFEAFRFNIDPFNAKNFKKEFQFALREKSGDLRKE